MHAVDDGVALGLKLLLDRRDRGAVDQRLGRRQRGRRVLCQAMREFAGRGGHAVPPIERTLLGPPEPRHDLVMFSRRDLQDRAVAVDVK